MKVRKFTVLKDYSVKRVYNDVELIFGYDNDNNEVVTVKNLEGKSIGGVTCGDFGYGEWSYEIDGEYPEVGMGCTECLWSDRHAGTITRVSDSFKTIWFKRDIATRVDSNGMSDCQDYEYKFDPDAPEHKATLRKDGRYRTVGKYGNYVALGWRDEYYDFSF